MNENSDIIRTKTTTAPTGSFISDDHQNETEIEKSPYAFGSALLSGFVFAVGLAISGMTLPEKVIHFLQWDSQWDPSLLFVMLGALPVGALGHWYMRSYYPHRFLPTPQNKKPLFDSHLHMPLGKDIDAKLIIGAVIFGIGWALGGYCPGPGIVSATAGQKSAIIFTISMTIGMILHHFFRQWFDHRFKN